MQYKIAYYVTPHGFGHAVRSLEVVRRLLEVAPGLEVELVTDVPSFLVKPNAGRDLPIHRRRLDVGLVQRDGIRFNLEATLAKLEDLKAHSDRLVEEETKFLKDGGFAGIVCDVPFLPIEAAARAGIEAVGISNFTWDWIYATYARDDPRWQPIIEWIRGCYARGGLFLQLPMHGDCFIFPEVRDVPLVARKPRRTREEVRRRLGIDPGGRAYLIAFFALDLDGEAMERLETVAGMTFLYKKPLSYPLRNGLCLDPFDDLSYVDVVNAVDGIITKPGYGIVSDCLATGTPMIHSDRGEFAEYPVLVDAIERHLTNVFMPSGDLYAGRWEEFILELEARPRRRPKLPTDGADVCARTLLARFNVGGDCQG